MLEQSLFSGARRYYEDFYKEWLETQRQYLKDLQEALKRGGSEQELKALVQRAAKHYAYYYRIKDEAAKKDILQFFTPAWKTPLEAAFMWIGGWRPSLVFQLAYAQAGQQIEEELAELIAGIEAPTVASITALQLEKINELHVKTLKLEENYSQQEAVLQQGFADQPFVSLAQSVTPAALGEGGSSNEALEETVETLEGNIDEKLKELEKLLHEADSLRAEALHGVLEIFTIVQAAQFLVAAAQLQLAYKAIGNKKKQEEQQKEQEHRAEQQKQECRE